MRTRKREDEFAWFAIYLSPEATARFSASSKGKGIRKGWTNAVAREDRLGTYVAFFTSWLRGNGFEPTLTVREIAREDVPEFILSAFKNKAALDYSLEEDRWELDKAWEEAQDGMSIEVSLLTREES